MGAAQTGSDASSIEALLFRERLQIRKAWLEMSQPLLSAIRCGLTAFVASFAPPFAFKDEYVLRRFSRFIDEIERKWGPVSWLVALERQKSGNPHVHPLIALHTPPDASPPEIATQLARDWPPSRAKKSKYDEQLARISDGKCGEKPATDLSEGDSQPAYREAWVAPAVPERLDDFLRYITKDLLIHDVQITMGGPVFGETGGSQPPMRRKRKRKRNYRRSKDRSTAARTEADAR